MVERFSGFNPKLFKFLKELAKNNNRDWFNENKPRFVRDVQQPVCGFIEAIAPKLHKISKYYVADPRPHGGSMFRIYRDARFSKDKRPYKENVGCHFRHEQGKDAHAPGFYLHLDPKEVFIAAGIWMPPNAILNKIRDKMAENPKVWQRVLSNTTLNDYYAGLSNGDSLKRVPRNYDPKHELALDLKRKSYILVKQIKPSSIYRDQFLQEVEMGFKAAKPLMKFLSDALEVKF